MTDQVQIIEGELPELRMTETGVPTYEPRYSVRYAKPEIHRDVTMGLDWMTETRPELLTLVGIFSSWVEVARVQAPNLEAVFAAMQGEKWSPNGERRELIEGLGLTHTSMSIGDLIEDTDNGNLWMVDSFGFKQVRY